jgi:precorrin-2/cobalt-factor-2 C20-methyltransferase
MGGGETMSAGAPPGMLYGLGVGPGDPELMTLKALRILRAAPVVAYPSLESGKSFARDVVARWLAPDKHEIPIGIPMTQERAPAQGAYARAVVEIARHLDSGQDVACLCEGDPLFYGSFMYLAGRLAGHYRIEVVPGVTSLVACAAALGHGLAARDDVLAVIPATLDEAALAARLEGVEAAAIVKLGRHFVKVRTLLNRLGLAPHARYIERASLSNQRILPLDGVDPTEVPYFSMILIHKRGEAWR